MSLIKTNPAASDSLKDVQGQAEPFRRTRPAPAFRPEIGRSLRMHPRVAATVALAVLAAVLGYASTLKPAYMAESRIYIEPAVSSPLSDPSSGGLFDSVRYDSYLQQQMQTATRVDILKSALETLPAGTWAAPGEPIDAAARRLGAALKVARVTTSYQMSISLPGPDAKKTAATVNAVTTAYLDAGRKDELSHSNSRAQILTEERGRITRELADARAEQTALGNALGVASPGTQAANPYDDQLTALRGELVAARQAHDAAAAQLTSVAGPDAASSAGLNALATDMAASDPGLSSLKSSLNQRRAQIVEQMSSMKPENPAYKNDQAELSDLNRVLDGMQTQLRDQAARRLEDKLHTELQRTGDLEGRLNSELARGTAAASGAAPKLQRSQELTANIARLTARYGSIDDALRTLELETHGMPMAHLSLAAAIPAQPEPSRRKVILLAALPLALFAACFVAALLHRRERRVYLARDMEELLGFMPIAVLPARTDVSAAVLEEYVLRLAGGIENAFRTRGARTFVLTPVSASTSLRFLLELLAAKLTELGLHVATVSASEMLQGPPAGTALTPTGTHEGRVSAALDRLKASCDLIFVAAPALLTSAEAEYVARTVDATILVAACGVTLKDELTAAATLLEHLQVTGVGTVLDELKLRYADAGFRSAVASVEARARVDAPARQVPLQAASAVAAESFVPAPAASVVEPVQAVAEPIRSSAGPASELAVAPDHSPAPSVFAAEPGLAVPDALSQEIDLTHSAHHSPITAAETHGDATRPVEPVREETPSTIQAEPAAQAVRSAAPPSLSNGHRTVLSPVWPAAPARAEPGSLVRAFEEELMSAKGTSVFLKPRSTAERRVERLEPLGAQDSLGPAATLLAASFGALPIEIEPIPAEIVYPKGTSPEEVEALRAVRANRAALAAGKLIGPPAEPVEIDELRRLLNPVRAETSIATRNGKDMIGARAVSEAARQTRLEGWAADGDAAMSAKRNWFQKLFSRDVETGASFVPHKPEEEADEESTDSKTRGNSLFDLPMDRPAVQWGSVATAVAEPEVEIASAQPLAHAEVAERLVVAEQTGFRPVARVVSLLTPVEPVPPAGDTASAHVTAAPASTPAQPRQAPRIAAARPAPPTAPPAEPAPMAAKAQLGAAEEYVHTLPPPLAKRPKSFLELTQARRRPALAALVAERTISMAATPSMLQDNPSGTPAFARAPAASAPEMHKEPAVIEAAPALTGERSPELAQSEAAESAESVAELIEQVDAETIAEPVAELAPVPGPTERNQDAVAASQLMARQEPFDRAPYDRAPYEQRNGTSAAYVEEPKRPEFPQRSSPAQWPSTQTPSRPYQPAARAANEAYAEQDEPRLRTRSEARPASLDPALSRRWGLLSRYQQTDRTQFQPADDDGRRERE